MDKENSNTAMVKPTVRITRARAKVLGTSGIPLPKPPEQKRASRANSKRTSVDVNKTFSNATAYPHNKRRVVFADISNALGKEVPTEGSRGSVLQKCVGSKQAKKPITRKNSKVVPAVAGESQNQEDVRPKLVEDSSKVIVVTEVLKQKPEIDTIDSVADHCGVTSPQRVKENLKILFSSSAGPRVTGAVPVPRKFKSSGLEFLFKNARRCDSKPEAYIATRIINIDSKHGDPLMCTAYAADIHNQIRTAELGQRPSSNYMEKLQRDITQSMRAILIDWLVEVSEEYSLASDTVYLTVNLIDRYLSQSYIEKQRLQLLGVTCMLIASKYEEITVPRVEEFCFITDNTYNRDEVVKMESEVLNLLHFKLSIPTTKTFLRRFLQAAHASSENPSLDVEYLANYLAELTLLECSFLKYLPSLIAASAVFLAHWTVDPSVHPWNPTLEHYTSYKLLQLKDTVVALQDLQSNKKGCTLNAIREKYRQGKFICVANLASKPVETLFTC